MIRNVLGKAVTKSTLMRLPEYDGESEISGSDMARVALALKNSQGKEKDEEEARSYVDRLRDQWARNKSRLTLGWIYNASGCAITLVDSHDWKGGLASWSLYPVRIENGQWGVFLHKQPSYETEYESESAGAVLYEAFHSINISTSYWCVAWNNQPTKSFSNQAGPVVHAWINKSKVYWDEFVSENVRKSFDKIDSSHSAKREGFRSVISSSPGPHVVFEALLTMEYL